MSNEGQTSDTAAKVAELKKFLNQHSPGFEIPSDDKACRDALWRLLERLQQLIRDHGAGDLVRSAGGLQLKSHAERLADACVWSASKRPQTLQEKQRWSLRKHFDPLIPGTYDRIREFLTQVQDERDLILVAGEYFPLASLGQQGRALARVIADRVEVPVKEVAINEVFKSLPPSDGALAKALQRFTDELASVGCRSRWAVSASTRRVVRTDP